MIDGPVAPGEGGLPEGIPAPGEAPPSPQSSLRPPEEHPEKPSRWQALCQRADEPLFVLNRRRTLLFVNRAWESLTGMSAAEARHLVCQRRRPVTLADTPRDILAHLLCPPPEALQGVWAQVRRLLPAAGDETRWWDVEFTPLHEKGRLRLLGRIVPLPAGQAAATPPLPPRLAALRQQVQRRLNLFLPTANLATLRRLAEQVRLAAGLRCPVVLIGEPGSGKQTLARLIHAHGPQRERSFAALDCTRLPAWSVGALLLADAGAVQRRQLGSLYLHEPGRLPRDLQLLLWERLLQPADPEDEPNPSGTSSPPHAGSPEALPRLLVGFSTDPRGQIAAGQLLEELFCALDTLRLELPPLRNRLTELPLLIERCLARLNSDGEKSIAGLAPPALEMLARHAWPGNLAELLQVLDQARQRSASERITADDLPFSLRLPQRLDEMPGRAPVPLPRLDEVLEQVERRLIVLALERTKGHKGKAAELLGVWRPRLFRRMQALGISDPAPETED